MKIFEWNLEQSKMDQKVFLVQKESIINSTKRGVGGEHHRHKQTYKQHMGLKQSALNSILSSKERRYLQKDNIIKQEGDDGDLNVEQNNGKEIVELLTNGLELGFDHNSLNLSNRNITDDMVPELCQWIEKLGSKVHELTLNGNKITSRGGALLFDGLKHNDHILKLYLRSNKIGDECMKNLGQMLTSNKVMQVIWLDQKTNISDKGIKDLMMNMKENVSMRSLSIANNKTITNKSIPFLVKIIEKSRIERINVDRTSITTENLLVYPLMTNRLKNNTNTMYFNCSSITDEDIADLCNLLRKFPNNKLKVLECSFEGNEITAIGASLLFQTLKELNNTSRILLNVNRIGDDCMKSLGEFLQNNDIVEHVELSRNEITDKGIVTLAPYISGNTKLKALEFAFNTKITDESVPLLSNMLTRSKIEVLNIEDTSISMYKEFILPLASNIIENDSAKIDFHECGVTDKDIEEMCKLLASKAASNLEDINLSSNKISPKGALILFSALKNCKLLKSINLNGNIIDDDCIPALGELIESNELLEKVGISGPVQPTSRSISDKGLKTLALYLQGNIKLNDLNISHHMNINNSCADLLKEIAIKTCVKKINLYGTSMSDEVRDEVVKCFQSPIESREIPIFSTSKSAAKADD